MSRRTRQNPALNQIDTLRLALRRRAVPPIGATLTQSLSGETFSGGGVTFSTTPSAIANSVTFTYSSGALTHMSTHGAIVVPNGTFNYWANGNNGGGTPSSWAVGLEHYGAHATFYFRTLSTTAQYWVFIDDKPLTAAPVALTGLTAGQSFYAVDLPFATTAFRRIKIYISLLHAQGFVVAKTDCYGPVAQLPWSILFYGDSWVEGANSIFLDTWCYKVARALGAEAYICGQGGTGYINNGPGGGATIYGNTGRMDAAAQIKPDLIYVEGSVNDSANSTANTKVAAAAFLTGMMARFPGVPTIVQGVQSISHGAGSDTNYGMPNDGVIAAGAAAPNVIATVDPRTENWVTGTGAQTHVTGDGNGETVNASDYIHLTAVGNDLYARRVLAKISSLLIAA